MPFVGHSVDHSSQPVPLPYKSQPVSLKKPSGHGDVPDGQLLHSLVDGSHSSPSALHSQPEKSGSGSEPSTHSSSHSVAVSLSADIGDAW